MSIRNLDYLLKPRSIVLIGASKKPSSVGSVLAQNLFRSGFDGPIVPVHPKHSHVHSVVTYPDVGSLPFTADLAVVATPPDTVPGLIDQLGKRGTKAAVVITAGFGEVGGAKGRVTRQAMLDAARPHLLRIVGPNCLGLMVPGLDVNASFGRTIPRRGHLAFVAQSGAIVASIVDWATSRSIGFSHLVSLGDMSDVDFGDMLDYLANDRDCHAILLYAETITHARKFMSAGRAAARSKPVIVVKAGRHAEGAKAAASHTGALAGDDVVYDTAFRRAGMLRVVSLEELFDAVQTLGTGPAPRGESLAIVTNGGGIGVLATDALIDRGGQLAELSSDTLAGLDKVLPATWSRANPIDIIGDATGQRYRDALEVVLQDPNIDAALVLNCPTAVTSGVDAARTVADLLLPGQRTSVFTSWVGNGDAQAAREIFAAQNIPSYDTPEQAVRAFMHMVDYRRNQELLIETPPSIPEEFSPDTKTAKAIIGKVLDEKRAWLTELEAKAVLAAYQIPIATTEFAPSPQRAAAVAAQLGGPVALKILSRDITHKSDVGGVVLNLSGPGAVHEAAAAMLDRVAAARPEASVDGFTVQTMIHRPSAFELLIGVTDDAQFGPVIVFGQGGTAVEVINDSASALPPLNMHLAKETISRTRVSRRLKGYRTFSAVDLDAIALTMIKVSQLVVDFAELKELDINPLLADAYGVIALDGRLRVERQADQQENRLAIRPYPKELVEEVRLADGRTLILRPVMPEDEPALQAGFAKLTPEEVRLRFFVPLKVLSHVQAARFTQIDYDREMALVLTDAGIPGKTEIFGVVRIYTDPDKESAEFAIVIQGSMTGLGLGTRLMKRIIHYARDQEIGAIFGDVLAENARMLKLCEKLGFKTSALPDDPSIVRVSLDLRRA